MAKQPIEYEPYPSKIGLKVTPEFSVFQTPPEAAAAYQVDVSAGSTTKSEILPDIRAGPIFRKRRGETTPELIPGVSSLGVSESCPDVRAAGTKNVEERHNVDKATYIQLLLRMLHSCSEDLN
jgi:hypothetical protein